MRIGDWTEHISSSGKKYFYNAKTEVSQWEKPREWLEWEKKEVDRQERQRNHDKSKDRDRGMISLLFSLYWISVVSIMSWHISWWSVCFLFY